MRTHDGEYTADAVILAMGSAYRKLGLPREDELSGHGVSWCATCDGFFFRGKDIAVVGGGDTADGGGDLPRPVRQHGHDRPSTRRAAGDARSWPTGPRANDKIHWALNSEVVDIHGEHSVEGLRLRDTVTGAERDIEVGGLFIAIGHDPRSELVAGQVDIDAEGYIKVNPSRGDASTSTNLAGVFAAGDVVDHTYRQAITAAGTGCAAALDAQHYLEALRDEAAVGVAPSVPASV